MWIDLILPSGAAVCCHRLAVDHRTRVIGVIVAEFFTAFAGLGNLIVTNANSFRTDRTFVPILLIALLGITLTALLEWAERKVVRWAAKD
jgi:ABC-type nitrate/sulfonate/bicarbonate transport system permease component